MLLFKRILTTFVAFVLLFFIFWVGGLFVGDLAAAARATIQYRAGLHGEPADRVEQRAAAHDAIHSFGRSHSISIAWCALAVSAIAAPALSFGGAFVWCRKKPGPPFRR